MNLFFFKLVFGSTTNKYAGLVSMSMTYAYGGRKEFPLNKCEIKKRVWPFSDRYHAQFENDEYRDMCWYPFKTSCMNSRHLSDKCDTTLGLRLYTIHGAAIQSSLNSNLMWGCGE